MCLLVSEGYLCAFQRVGLVGRMMSLPIVLLKILSFGLWLRLWLRLGTALNRYELFGLIHTPMIIFVNLLHCPLPRLLSSDLRAFKAKLRCLLCSTRIQTYLLLRHSPPIPPLLLPIFLSTQQLHNTIKPIRYLHLVILHILPQDPLSLSEPITLLQPPKTVTSCILSILCPLAVPLYNLQDSPSHLMLSHICIHSLLWVIQRQVIIQPDLDSPTSIHPHHALSRLEAPKHPPQHPEPLQNRLQHIQILRVRYPSNPSQLQRNPLNIQTSMIRFRADPLALVEEEVHGVHNVFLPQPPLEELEGPLEFILVDDGDIVLLEEGVGGFVLEDGVEGWVVLEQGVGVGQGNVGRDGEVRGFEVRGGS